MDVNEVKNAIDKQIIFYGKRINQSIENKNWRDAEKYENYQEALYRIWDEIRTL